MPEGHTLHRLARELDGVFAGRRVRTTSPQGRFSESAALLDGTLLRGAEAYGKNLFLRFSRARWVHVHLGLYGTFVVSEGAAAPPRGAVRLRLSTRQAYADLRGPMRCALVTEAEREAALAALGPDPLRADADPDLAWARIRTSRRPVGVLLMEQSVLAGVGNVYRAEVLFRHGVDPQVRGCDLPHAVWRAVWSDLVELMHDGVRTGTIDTVRDQHRSGRKPRGSLSDQECSREVYVYRRAGDPCRVCSTPVARAEMAGRNLFWCPTCQNGVGRDPALERAG